MKKEKLSQLISEINEEYINEAASITTEEDLQTKKQPHLRRWLAVAACFILLVGIGTAAFAIGAEAKEYRAAVSFFEENGLSMEGLSRTEVKAVYRDITTNSFTYEKTAEVLQRTVPGWEITQDEPTPEELAVVWNESMWLRTVPITENGYLLDNQFVLDEQKGFDVLEKSILKCCREGETLWQAEFPDFYAEQFSLTDDGILVWGTTYIYSSSEPCYAWLAFVDHTGKILWQRRFDHGFDYESIADVLQNEDGSWAVIGRGDFRFLCLSRYDAQGNELSFRKTEVGNLGIWNVARLGDGFIVQLEDRLNGVSARLCRMDREGNVIADYSYEAENCKYYLTDMIEFGGKVYLSAYATAKQEHKSGRDEIAPILDYAYSQGSSNIPSEKLTPVVRDNYTAVLLLCSPQDGTPKTFYSVKGSLGGKLSVNEEGQLEWDVESVTHTFYSPATSSFTIGGTCKVYRYTFDAAGTLLSQTDTGETVPYRR